MGQAFKKHLEKKGYEVLVSGRSTELTHEQLAKQADIVIISVPISNTVEIIEKIAPHLRPKTILADFTSIKAEPLYAMLSAHAGPVVGLHPVFGPENVSPGQTIVICPGRDEKAQKKVEQVFSDFHLIELEAKEHDKAMALVQGLQHFLETAFAATTAKMQIPLDTLLAVSSPIYRVQMDLVGRIIGQNERLYDEIVHGTKMSTQTIQLFLEVAQKIAADGSPEFLQAFRDGREYFGDFCSQAKRESNEIIDFLASRSAQKLHADQAESEEITDLGVLGPELTWSDLAAQKFYTDKSKRLYPSFPAIFAGLQNNEIAAALLPIENKIAGTVRQVWEGIAADDLWISRVIDLPIAHVLAAPQKQHIETIFAHDSALAQCRKYLAAQYPKAQQIPVASNSEAIVRARSMPGAAAICSQQAAELAEFAILAEHIADRDGNATRFALVQKKTGTKKLGGERLTTIFFGLKNVSGALFGILKIFADANINLVRLESMPTGDGFAEYAFFIDFEGEYTDELAIKLERLTTDLRVLGHYSTT